MKIGFIGLGVMGAPMAAHLRDAGHSLVTTLNRSPLPSSLEGTSVEVVSSPAMVAQACDTIITMLPDGPDVEKVFRGPNGLLEAPSIDGSLFIDMSSISPILTRELAAAASHRGAGYIDAPVSGGEIGARAATLTIMVGGKRSLFQRALPLLEALGKNITLVGEENGAGQLCKIANQIVVGVTIAAVGEALVLASKAGCDPDAVRSALLGGFASSRVLEVHAQRMIKRQFNPGFSIKLHQKDLGNALAAARAVGAVLPHTAICQELFNSCAAAGDGDLDHSALVHAFEGMSAHRLGS